MVSVPSVVGLDAVAAGDALASSGLVAAFFEAYSDTVPEGSVLAQTPAAEIETARGAVVEVVLSRGPQPVAVPNVAGLPTAEAQALVEAAGLSAVIVPTAHDIVPAGRVASQTPSPGTLVRPGTVVNLAVSQGPSPVTVPNVIGLTQPQARAALHEVQLTQGLVQQAYSDVAPVGVVISQSPQGSDLVTRGSAVNVVVSRGPEPATVPRVVALNIEDARSAIEAARLRVEAITEIFSANAPVGSVMAQSAAPGTALPAGSPITLTVSKGPEPVEVPHVVGLTRAEAETAILRATLAVGTVHEVFDDAIPALIVISQSPVSATLALPRTPVHLTVSKGPEPRVVPEVIALARTEAVNAILDAGFVLGLVGEVFSDEIAADKVISQSPSANSLAIPGTAIDIVISLGFVRVDTDGDGLWDGHEIQLGTDPANPDTDGDRVSDGVEHEAGTDPLDPEDNPLPRIGAFTINNHVSATISRNVKLQSTCRPEATQYMASESPDFSGAVWRTYSPVASFDLSLAKEMKTVYFKVRNAYGESSVVSDTIGLPYTEYVFDRQWPDAEQALYYANLYDVAVDDGGNVYLCDASWDYRITKITPSGDVVFDIASDYPSALAVAADGSLYVGNIGDWGIYRFSATGEHLGTIARSPAPSSSAADLAFGPDGTIYVSDIHSHTVARYAQDGTQLARWGGFGTEQSQFRSPYCVAVDHDGFVYVGDFHNRRVKKFTADGTFVAEWGTGSPAFNDIEGPIALAFSPDGLLYVADYWAGRVQVFTDEGVFVRTLIQDTDDRRIITRLTGMAVGNDGMVYLADYWGGLSVFTPDGAFDRTMTVSGTDPGRMRDVGGLGVTPAGNIVVADTSNDRIQVFNEYGSLQSYWSTPGRPYGLTTLTSGLIWATIDSTVHLISPEGISLRQWYYPYASSVAVDSEENVYVGDARWSSAIEKRTSRGHLLHSISSPIVPGAISMTLDVGPEDLLYVAAGRSTVKRLFCYYPDGSPHPTSGAPLNDWSLSIFSRIAVSPTGLVWLTDFDRVLGYLSDGTLVAILGSRGNGPGQFLGTGSVTISGDAIYVSDECGRIQRFVPSSKGGDH